MTQSFSVMRAHSEPGPHTAAINFINDAYSGPGLDRNLYVVGANYNGVASSPALRQTCWRTAQQLLTIAGSSPAVTSPSPSPPAPGASDGLVLHVSEDSWQGDAQFLVTVDGTSLGGVRTATASHGATPDAGSVRREPECRAARHRHHVPERQVGAAAAATDRNLYLDGVDLNGAAVAGSARTLFGNGSMSVYVGVGRIRPPSHSTCPRITGRVMHRVTSASMASGSAGCRPSRHRMALGQAQQAMSFMVPLSVRRAYCVGRTGERCMGRHSGNRPQPVLRLVRCRRPA